MTFRFERSKDYLLIREIMTHPKIYGQISDDFSPPSDQFEPIEHDGIWYVVVYEGMKGTAPLGLWMFHPHNTILWEVHTCLLPSTWGSLAAKAAPAMARWLWENTPCRALVTYVPEFNLLACAYAKKAGMQYWGTIFKSFLKNGELHDQVVLGLLKP